MLAGPVWQLSMMFFEWFTFEITDQRFHFRNAKIVVHLIASSQKVPPLLRKGVRV
jgi:hypothetical protein